jgi:hypothetical protein
MLPSLEHNRMTTGASNFADVLLCAVSGSDLLTDRFYAHQFLSVRRLSYPGMVLGALFGLNLLGKQVTAVAEGGSFRAFSGGLPGLCHPICHRRVPVSAPRGVLARGIRGAAGWAGGGLLACPRTPD